MQTGGSEVCGLLENELLGRMIDGHLTGLSPRRNRFPTALRLLITAGGRGGADAAPGGIDRHGAGPWLLDRTEERDCPPFGAYIGDLNEFHVVGESAGGCNDCCSERGNGKCCIDFHVSFGVLLIC